jgi:hypothetical protein
MGAENTIPSRKHFAWFRIRSVFKRTTIETDPIYIGQDYEIIRRTFFKAIVVGFKIT